VAIILLTYKAVISYTASTKKEVFIKAANRLDRRKASPIPLVIAFARLAAEFHSDIAQMQGCWKIAAPDEYAYLQRDIQSLTNLKKRLVQIRQEKIGATLLKI